MSNLSARDRADLLADLVTVVQCRSKTLGRWQTIAAFNVKSVAKKYMKECEDENSRFYEYRIVDCE